ncbi:MAG: twin-arginine translocation signal domain-containing protein, partial [Dongiaceae bacterium]
MSTRHRNQTGRTVMKDLDILLKEMGLGRMGRREFLGRAAALGVTATAGAALLSQSTYAATPK